MKILLEMKAKKAKFGFKLEQITIPDLIPIGRILEALSIRYDDNQYRVELVGMSQNGLRLYTDDEYVAACVRDNFCKPC